MRQVQRLRHRLVRISQTLWTSSGIPEHVDVMVFHRAPAGGSDAQRSAVLLAPPGGGNIGDQAMVEAFIENTPGPIRVLVRRHGDITVPSGAADRVDIEPMPALVYGSGAAHRMAIRDLGRVLATASSFSVVGADIMDGAYNVRASVRRATLARLAAATGVDTRVLGFSWNGHAAPAARRALARAAGAGVRLLLRDPISAERAREDGLCNVQPVADTVFAAASSSDTVADSLLGSSTDLVAVLNASGLVGRSIDQVPAYVEIIAALRARGLTVVLLPHVVRSSADDLVACRAIFDAVPADPHVILIDRIVAPAEVRGLCARASLVLTGRMHLAIQALWSGRPAITLSTQGKVEGLMRLFDTAYLCVEPGRDLAARVIPIVDELLSQPDTHVSRIRSALPAVTELARANFSRHPAPTPTIITEKNRIRP